MAQTLQEPNEKESNTMQKWRVTLPPPDQDQVKNREGGEREGRAMRHLAKPLDLHSGQMSGCCGL